MKLIIAGSRHLRPDFGFILSAIKMLKPGTITEVVSGCASGVDQEGEHWASHMNIPVMRFPADWIKLGKSAGPIRNEQMAKHADCLLLIWDGKSLGSKNMLSNMKKLNKPVFEVIIKSDGKTTV